MNGVEVVEATPEESARIAHSAIEKALKALDNDEPDHVRMYLHSALIWLRA